VRSSGRPMYAASHAPVDQLVESLGCGSAKSEVQKVAGLLDEQVKGRSEAPRLRVDYPYLFVDAKVRRVETDGRVAAQGRVVVIAQASTRRAARRSAVSTSARRRTETFWREYTASLSSVAWSA